MEVLKGILKGIAIFVIAMLVISGISSTLARQQTTTATTANQDRLLKNITKSEYLEIATKNCAEDPEVTESFCRCFYAELLDRYSIEEVGKMDIEADANPDTYQFTDEQLRIVTQCYATKEI